MKGGKTLQTRNRKGSFRRYLDLSFIWSHDSISKMWRTNIRRVLFRKKVSSQARGSGEGGGEQELGYLVSYPAAALK